MGDGEGVGQVPGLDAQKMRDRAHQALVRDPGVKTNTACACETNLHNYLSNVCRAGGFPLAKRPDPVPCGKMGGGGGDTLAKTGA